MAHEWLGRPIETAILTRIPGGRRFAKHVELGGAGLGIVLLADQSRRYQSRWTEYEAWWLTYGAEPSPDWLLALIRPQYPTAARRRRPLPHASTIDAGLP